MPSTPWDAKQIGEAPLVTAPDGSEARVLCAMARGSMIRFSLKPNVVSQAVAHGTVEEIWYVTAGRGQLWRRFGDQEEVVELSPGLSATIPTGVSFQFRNDGATLLEIIAVTMPPWPGGGEAYPVAGKWEASI